MTARRVACRPARREEHGRDDGEQLPLGREQIQHEAESRTGSDEDCLDAADRRRPQPAGMPRGVRQEDEDGGDPARGDGPQTAPGANLARPRYCTGR
ncbi:hypothetical protein ACFWZJ_31140 [Streptomyces massasporeus]